MARADAGTGPAAEQPVCGGDDRVEVSAGDRPEQQDQDGEAQGGGVEFSRSWSPTSSGDSCCAAMPEPTTTVTSSRCRGTRRAVVGVVGRGDSRAAYRNSVGVQQ